MQEQRRPPKLCVSSSFNLQSGVSNNPKEVVAISINRVRLSRRETLNVKEEYLELATRALQETLKRFTNGGIDRGALVIAMLTLALHNLALVDGPKELAEALHRLRLFGGGGLDAHRYSQTLDWSRRVWLHPQWPLGNRSLQTFGEPCLLFFLSRTTNAT
jgi:hypothetical protein